MARTTNSLLLLSGSIKEIEELQTQLGEKDPENPLLRIWNTSTYDYRTLKRLFLSRYQNLSLDSTEAILTSARNYSLALKTEIETPMPGYKRTILRGMTSESVLVRWLYGS